MKRTNSAFSRRLRTGSLAGTLGVAGALPLATVNGAIIYSGIQNINSSGAGTPVNVDNSGGPEFLLDSSYAKGTTTGKTGGVYSWQTYSYSIIPQPNISFLSTPLIPYSQVTQLKSGSLIGISSLFSGGSVSIGSYKTYSNSLPVATGWSPGTEGFFGFSFPSPQGGSYYGWGRLRYASATSMKLLDWAYDDSGSSISAGQMPSPAPEPTAGVMLALAGFVGAGLRRRPNTRTFSGV